VRSSYHADQQSEQVLAAGGSVLASAPTPAATGMENS